MRGTGFHNAVAEAAMVYRAQQKTNRWIAGHKRLCWKCQKEHRMHDGHITALPGGAQKFLCNGCYIPPKPKAMKKPAWSHSSLKDYEGCARRYQEVKVLKKYPFQETEATRYGNQVHESLELYVKEGRPIPPEHAQFKPVVDALMERPGRKLPEQKMALDVDLNPVDWFDKAVWVRGIADLLVINDDDLTAWVVDYKTGNNKYPDRDQLVLMSLMVFAHYPHVRRVNSALLFLVKNDMVKHRMERDEVEAAWWRYRERTAKLEASYANDVWNPTPTPLCNWCPCTGCEFHPKH